MSDGYMGRNERDAEALSAEDASGFGARLGFGRATASADDHDPDDGDMDDDLAIEDGPDRRPRRSRGARRPSIVFLNLLMTGAVFAVIGAGGVLVYGKTRFEAAGPTTADTSFIVREGAGVSAVATELERAGLIEDTRLFTIAARVTGNDRAIKTGEFAIPAGASMARIMEELTEGSPIEYRVTIPEGFTVWEAMQRIAAHPELTGDMPADMPPEGMLAAETISFARGETRANVIERLERIQAERLERAWASRSPDAPLDTPHNLLTIASLVEKETALPEERRDVAAVYSNRIRENWHLNADPTVIYGVYGGKGLPPGRSITQSDLADDNPYNTYRLRGMPAGPVAIPGEASLMAAAAPSDSKDMFFVADGTGGHIFARTLEEHNANVRRWRRIERGEEPRPERVRRGSAAAAPEATEVPEAEPVVAAASEVASEPSSMPGDGANPIEEAGTPAPDMPVPLMNPNR